MKKGSFFSRLTGGQFYEDEEDVAVEASESTESDNPENDFAEQDTQENEGQLAVDVYQTADQIVVEAMIAAVKPEDIDISITREMITIKGRRDNPQHVEDDRYFYRELYWGHFSRSVVLPQEVEPDESDAKIKNGLLTVSMPKIDKAKTHRLRAKVL